jgi:hypothetical protein
MLTTPTCSKLESRPHSWYSEFGFLYSRTIAYLVCLWARLASFILALSPEREERRTMQSELQSISRRMRPRARLSGGALFLAAIISLAASAQVYKSDQPDEAAKKLQSVVRNPANFQANQAQFKEYFNKYYFPTMTGSGPDELAALGNRRYLLFRDYLWKADNTQWQQTLTTLTYEAMAEILRPKNPPYHPAVRYNAVLILGMLDDQYAREGATTPARPHARSNGALTGIVNHAMSGKDEFPPAVVLGAVIGLERHAKLRAGLPANNVKAMTDALVKLVSQSQPIMEMDRVEYSWLRLRAANALATLGSPGQNNVVHDAFVKLIGDFKSTDDRCAAAALLAKIKYEGAKVDGAATADRLFTLARDLATEESKRANEFNEKQIASGGFAPGYSDGFQATGMTPPEKFPRRQVLARLSDLRAGLQAAKPLLPAESQPKIDELVKAIDPVRQLAIDKAVELSLTQAIIQMASDINLAVPAAQPEATTAATPEF